MARDFTTNQNQSERWAEIKKNRMQDEGLAIVTIYHIENDLLTSPKFKIKEFKQADEKWLDFVLGNRKGNEQHSFDIVIGPVGNDTLYATLALYEAEILSRQETIIRLKIHKLYD